MSAGIGLAGLGGSRLLADELANGAAERREARLAPRLQAWTFNQSTFFEAIDKTASLGLHYIEAIPGPEARARISRT